MSFLQAHSNLISNITFFWSIINCTQLTNIYQCSKNNGPLTSTLQSLPEEQVETQSAFPRLGLQQPMAGCHTNICCWEVMLALLIAATTDTKQQVRIHNSRGTTQWLHLLSLSYFVSFGDRIEQRERRPGPSSLTIGLPRISSAVGQGLLFLSTTFVVTVRTKKIQRKISKKTSISTTDFSTNSSP